MAWFWHVGGEATGGARGTFTESLLHAVTGCACGACSVSSQRKPRTVRRSFLYVSRWPAAIPQYDLSCVKQQRLCKAPD